MEAVNEAPGRSSLLRNMIRVGTPYLEDEKVDHLSIQAAMFLIESRTCLAVSIHLLFVPLHLPQSQLEQRHHRQPD